MTADIQGKGDAKKRISANYHLFASPQAMKGSYLDGETGED
jgi:hypothetical protein